MANNYILNKETSHIELHFDKADYLALTDAQKTELKSAFVFSRTAGAWVSRATNNHFRPIRIAASLGFEDGGKVGESLSYAEQVERKIEKAEHRAERFEEYAENADKRRETLQSEFNRNRGDIAYLTQPNINSSGGRAFTNYRNKVMARYEKGFEEYRKSEYFTQRAQTALETAAMAKYQDPVYLDNQIRACKATMRKLNKGIEYCEAREIDADDLLEKMEKELDKMAYMMNCQDQLGGVKYSKANIKKEQQVKIRGSWCKVLSVNPTTVRVLNSLGWDWMKYPYAEIQEVQPL